MLIESDKYQANSLRKGREQSLKEDIGNGYILFSHRIVAPLRTTINDFKGIWMQAQLHLLIHVGKYLYSAVRRRKMRKNISKSCLRFLLQCKRHIDSYFLTDSLARKTFCLFCMYFIASAVDSNGERNPRSIHVTAEFSKELAQFLESNRNKRTETVLRIIGRIEHLFVYSCKTGLRNPLVKRNGENFMRQRKVRTSNMDCQTANILPIDVQQNVEEYLKQKKTFMGTFLTNEPQKKEQLNSFDREFIGRMKQKFERVVFEELKKSEEDF